MEETKKTEGEIDTTVSTPVAPTPEAMPEKPVEKAPEAPAEEPAV